MPGTCEDVARQAEDWVAHFNKAPRIFQGAICYHAVVCCAKAAGVTVPTHCDPVPPQDVCLLAPTDPIYAVEGAGGMLNLPRGHFIVFYDLLEKDKRFQAKHAMISIGGGVAIGSNNACLNLLESPQWDRVNLMDTGRYSWGKAGIFVRREPGKPPLTAFHRDSTKIGAR
jgi:hypothetical protein